MVAFQSWANQGRLSGTQEMCVWDHREPVTAGSTVSLICSRASALRQEPGCPESWGCPRSMSRSTPEQVQQGPELRVQSGNDRREDGPTLGRREPPCTLFSVCAPLPAALSQSLVLTPVPPLFPAVRSPCWACFSPLLCSQRQPGPGEGQAHGTAGPSQNASPRDCQ